MGMLVRSIYCCIDEGDTFEVDVDNSNRVEEGDTAGEGDRDDVEEIVEERVEERVEASVEASVEERVEASVEASVEADANRPVSQRVWMDMIGHEPQRRIVQYTSWDRQTSNLKIQRQCLQPMF
jgi:hypothetical protein